MRTMSTRYVPPTIMHSIKRDGFGIGEGELSLEDLNELQDSQRKADRRVKINGEQTEERLEKGRKMNETLGPVSIGEVIAEFEFLV